MFLLHTSTVPTSCIYYKHNALPRATPFSAFSPLLNVMSDMPAWVMLNGPWWCNRVILVQLLLEDLEVNTKQTVHSQAGREILCKKEKSMYVIYIQSETLSTICSISKWTNLPWCLKPKSNLHVEPFSNCAPPHRALTRTIIQGRMDSNSPLMKVAQALSRESTEREIQVGQQLAGKRRIQAE